MSGAEFSPHVDIHCMDKDNGMNGRFCWPAQDRARAGSPSRAPRISSVFTASVYSRSASPFPGSCRSSQSSFLALPPRKVCSPRRRGGFGVDKVCCGCCIVGFPGQSRPLHGSSRLSKVPGVASAGHSDPWKDGVALGFNFLAIGFNPPLQGELADPLADPDWRIVGDQDPTDPF